MKKRSVTVAGHATSISLEEPFWQALRDLAAERDKPLNGLIAEIDAQRGADNLSSALRLWVLSALQEKISKSEVPAKT